MGVGAPIEVYSTDNEGIDIHDLTDGAGHGLLVATDSIWLTQYLSIAAAGSIGFTSSIGTIAEIIYRFKKVTLQEYIGIVQSQQN